jgi:methionyl-tRNA formyltransferase|tara:strand:+ start:3636 stop:4295 length:660 start_codon:yes stop_codon:yes gene_type:complete
MIIKIDKKPEDLVIGVIGFRSEHILKALRKHNLECIMFNPDFPHPCDILIGSGVYSILPNDIITLPTYGTYIIHETPLPEGRGHAPIQWTLSNNRPNFCLSLFKADEGVDNGYIVYQHNVEIDDLDSCTDIEQKRGDAITECVSVFLEEVVEGVIVLRKQTGKSTYFKKRTPLDSCLDSVVDSQKLWNALRLCDNKAYPAYITISGHKIYIKYYKDDNK